MIAVFRPLSLLARLRYHIGSRRVRPAPYRAELIGLLHEFVLGTHGAGLPRDEFEALAERELEGLGAALRHVSDLWELFEPDYRDRLPAYYDSLALLNTLRFVDYAGDEAFVVEHYLKPYEAAASRLGTLSVLEVGVGIPHGLIRLQLTRPGVIRRAALNDIDATYTRFACWFCERESIPVDWIPATAGLASDLPEGRFNFVLAKDVFEHLHDPELMLRRIIAAAEPEAVLALDLEDKGDRIYQHVSPQLAPLRAILAEGGWQAIGKTGVTTLFAR
jgi:hypothetical protein